MFWIPVGGGFNKNDFSQVLVPRLRFQVSGLFLVTSSCQMFKIYVLVTFSTAVNKRPDQKGQLEEEEFVCGSWFRRSKSTESHLIPWGSR